MEFKYNISVCVCNDDFDGLRVSFFTVSDWEPTVVRPRRIV